MSNSRKDKVKSLHSELSEKNTLAGECLARKLISKNNPCSSGVV